MQLQLGFVLCLQCCEQQCFEQCEGVGEVDVLYEIVCWVGGIGGQVEQYLYVVDQVFQNDQVQVQQCFEVGWVFFGGLLEGQGYQFDGEQVVCVVGQVVVEFDDGVQGGIWGNNYFVVQWLVVVVVCVCVGQVYYCVLQDYQQVVDQGYLGEVGELIVCFYVGVWFCIQGFV